MEALNHPSFKADRALHGAGIAQAPDRVGTSSPCATRPLPQRGLQFSCATGLTNDSREGVVLGRLKELAGHAEDSIECADATTIEQLFALYTARHPELAKYRSSVVASRNQEFAAWDTPLRTGDEVAFLPPVSGG